MNSNEKMELIRQALDSKQTGDMEIIDIHELSPIADYFVIGTVKNNSQMNAAVDAVEEELSKAKLSCKHAEGSYASGWVLMDCGDVVVHLFSEEQRGFYDLDRIWRDGKFITA